MNATQTRRTAATSSLLVLLPLALAGCATFSEDGGFGSVSQAVEQRLGEKPVWYRGLDRPDDITQRLEAMLAQPLTAEDAVRIALLNNSGLQASLAELRLAEADVVQAGRLRNPGFSYARLQRGDDIEIERTVFFDVLGLFTLPIRTQIATRLFEQAKLRAAGEIMAVAAETRKAYFAALAAQQAEQYLVLAQETAAASAELARRLTEVGNWSRLQLAREQTFYAEVTARLARARQAAVSKRERLIRMLGLSGNDIDFKLPGRLPDLPASAREVADLEGQALKERLDIQAGQLESEGVARALGLTKVTRFINVLELGVVRNSSNQEPTQRGYQIELVLPLFDWGGGRVAKAEAIYLQSVYRLRETAVNARSEVREAYHGYRTAFDVAKHYRDEIVPLRKMISEENLLRYNGMLISTFELLADAREQVLAVNGYIEALRDYWLAETDLQAALSVRSPGAMRARTSAMPAPGGSAGGR